MITDAHREQATRELAKFTPAQKDGLLCGIVAAFYAYENDTRLLDFAYETTALIELGKLGA